MIKTKEAILIRYEVSGQLREALGYLASDNLWAYDVERISLFVVGLRTVLFRDVPVGGFNLGCPAPVELLEVLVRTCSAIRSRLLELHVGQEHRAYEVLEGIIDHVSRLFSSSYHVSQDIIDQERFCDRVYRLLCELNLRDSGYGLSCLWDFHSADELKLEKDKYRQELLGFVKENPAEVVATVYHWAEKGEGHNAGISSQREEVFKLFFLIESEKSYLKIERLN